MEFEWDEAKNLASQRKHGLSFEQARELFLSGQDFLEVFDEAHSHNEDRFISIGPITSGIISVVWTERDEDFIRIISARYATKREAEAFHRYMEDHDRLP